MIEFWIENTTIFMQENEAENVVCKMAEKSTVLQRD